MLEAIEHVELHPTPDRNPHPDWEKVIINGWLSSSSCFLVTTGAEPKRAGPVPLVGLH